MKPFLTFTLIGCLTLGLCLFPPGANPIYSSNNPLFAQLPPPPTNKPNKIIRVPSRVKGVITNLLVVEGQAVKKGELLFQMDDRLAMMAVKIAAAKVSIAKDETDAAKVAHHEAVTQLERLMKLPKAAVSEEELAMKKITVDRTLIEVRAKAGAVQVADLGVERAEILLSMHRIQAPIDGTIGKIHRQPGEAAGELDTVVEIIVPIVPQKGS